MWDIVSDFFTTLIYTTMGKIKFNHQGEDMAEAMGFTKSQFDTVADGMHHYFFHQEHNPSKAYTAILEEYLESDVFRDTGLSIDDPNVLFFIGYIFSLIVAYIKHEGAALLLQEMQEAQEDIPLALKKKGRVVN